MRGPDEKQESMFSYISLEQRVPLEHPLRRVRAMIREVVAKARARRGGRERLDFTVGADKAYQKKSFIEGLRELGVAPHVAEYARSVPQWPNCLTEQEREHPGLGISRKKRKMIEKNFGWIKFDAGYGKTKYRGRRRVGWAFDLYAAASNLIRLAKLMPRAA